MQRRSWTSKPVSAVPLGRELAPWQPSVAPTFRASTCSVHRNKNVTSLKNLKNTYKIKQTLGSRLCFPPSVTLQLFMVKQGGGRYWCLQSTVD